MATPRKTAAARAKAVAQDVGGMCPEHFPHGWPLIAEGQASVACEHGQWTRADDNQTETDPADTDPETPPES